MSFPVILKLGFFNLSTIYIFLVLALILASFVVWYYGKKDGFNEEKLFDLFILSTGLTIGLFFLKFIGIYSFLIGGLGSIIFFARRWRWSVFRILDIYSLGWMVNILIFCLGYFILHKNKSALILSFICFVLYFTLIKLRDRSLKSGVVFSLFVCIVVLVGFFVNINLNYLIFYLILVTLSSVNLYFRFQKDMPNTQLPSNLFESLKNLLLKKEKSLEKEQKVLSEEDPYRPDSDRTSGNSEVIDEALLEDARKLEIDSQKRSVSGMQQLVRKALALMKLGKYGVCEVCGDAIDPARLKAFPEASTCIRHSK